MKLWFADTNLGSLKKERRRVNSFGSAKRPAPGFFVLLIAPWGADRTGAQINHACGCVFAWTLVTLRIATSV
jgi:hypothetical protein